MFGFVDNPLNQIDLNGQFAFVVIPIGIGIGILLMHWYWEFINVNYQGYKIMILLLQPQVGSRRIVVWIWIVK